MGPRIWKFIRRFGGWIAAVVGIVWLGARLLTDLVGRSTFVEDLVLLLEKLKPVTDFFARQPEWIFYPVCFLLILTGFAAAAANWAPVIAMLKARVQPSATPEVAVVPRRPPPLPEMSFGDMVRYIACDSEWGVEAGEAENWGELLDQEVIDQLARGALYAHGRFVGSHGRREGTPKLEQIDAEYWSHVELNINKYFLEPTDTNSVEGESYGYYDLRVYRRDVEIVWPPKAQGNVTRLPLLKEALAQREAVMAAR